MRCLAYPPFYIDSSLHQRRIASLLGRSSRVYAQAASRQAIPARFHSSLGAGSPNENGDRDHRIRLSSLWIPTGGIAENSAENSHAKLIRAGYLRQAHSGIFHMLPLGRRVQEKLEALIDKYMSKLNASKVSLSSITSEELWTKSGRLEGVGSELFRFRDRKDAGYLLAPTHEEEITRLVSSTTTSYKELPVRLYQISRKYRDEKRPRQGLLRSREFIMKDLYTFDYNASLALNTYQDVRKMYTKLFDELKIPYLVADADSGNMGGKLSHEFHFPTASGEDNVISCSKCDYVANEELAEARVPESKTKPGATQLACWKGISKDRQTLVNVWTSHDSLITPPEVNIHAVKSILPDLDTSIEDAGPHWQNQISIFGDKIHTPVSGRLRLINLVDARVSQEDRASIERQVHESLPEALILNKTHFDTDFLQTDPTFAQPLNLLQIREGDRCNRCTDGTLRVQKAIELGHTFHLGTRYSEPLEAMVVVPSNLVEDKSLVDSAGKPDSKASIRVPMHMGCHGIGVSRIIGAVADTLADEKGLNWPRVMAPYEVMVIPVKHTDKGALEVYDALSASQETADRTPLDLILDDRVETFPWKMGDADLVGYPVIVVVGRRWQKERICEVQCRRLKIRQDVEVGELPTFVSSLLAQL